MRDGRVSSLPGTALTRWAEGAGQRTGSSPAAELVGHSDAGGRLAARCRLERRTQLAWLTSLVSKVGTAGTQLVAVPMVYQTMGQDGYAAYAAVTSAVLILSALNLGIGGSLVTPVARAAAAGDAKREGELLRAGLIPLGLLTLAATVVALPVVVLIPLPVLLGEVAHVSVGGLRVALVVACAMTLLALPLTLVSNLRQAYQEIHVTNLLGAGANAVLCSALLLAAFAKAGLPVFVACSAGIPLAGNALNGWLLIAKRRYLLEGWREYDYRHSLALLGDGARFLAASFTNMLIYQWPIYLMAHSRPTRESAAFAISLQAVLLPLSLLFGMVQPFWGTVAEAKARGDDAWVRRQVRMLRQAGVALGLICAAVFAAWGNQALRIWLGKDIELSWSLRLCAGTYLALAIWEYLHFLLLLGVGRIREGSTILFVRAASFALLAPALIVCGGGTWVWAGLCCSVALYPAWRMPRVLRDAMGAAAEPRGTARAVPDPND